VRVLRRFHERRAQLFLDHLDGDVLADAQLRQGRQHQVQRREQRFLLGVERGNGWRDLGVHWVG
jgi:hypothetical protein